MAEGERFALYFSPDRRTSLGRFGRQWLGYDAASGRAVAQPTVASFTPERLFAVTAEPRLYGFHATLKPPFRLAPGCTGRDLAAAAAAFAAQQPEFLAPPLTLAAISDFTALVLARPCPAMESLAASCVEALDRFRAPPDAAELERRRRVGLSPAQEALLRRWGYPYVMAEFRFHMTLSGRLPPSEGESLRQALRPLVDKLCREKLLVDAVALFRQAQPSAPFRLVRRFPLAGARGLADATVERTGTRAT